MRRVVRDHMVRDLDLPEQPEMLRVVHLRGVRCDRTEHLLQLGHDPQRWTPDDTSFGTALPHLRFVMAASDAATVVRRIAVAAAVVLTAAALLVSACRTPEAPAGRARPEHESRQAWLDPRTTNRDALQAVLDALCAPMLNQGGTNHEAALDFNAPRDLYECARAVLLSLLSGDSTPYLVTMSARAATIDHAMCLAIAEDWSEWRLIHPLDTSHMDDAHLFQTLWSERSTRRMDIHALDQQWAEIGVGMSVDYARDRWPYEGVRASMSVFIPPTGRLSASEGQRIDGTPSSAHVTVRVVYGDGQAGMLRVNFFYDTTAGRWYPITLSVASDSLEQWPFPFF